MNDQSEKFKPGFRGHHKTTGQVCTTKHPNHNGKMIVVTTTTNGNDLVDVVVAPEQLWTEAEWEARNANELGAISHEPDFSIG